MLVFVLFNQAWFMGALFLIAGYFTPRSFDRKGSGSFIKGSASSTRHSSHHLDIRAISPISSIGYWQMPAELTGITNPLTWQAYPFLLGLGVAWFIAMLLIFNFGYAAWRWLTRNRTASPMNDPAPPSYLGIGIFILALALVSYLFRIIIPMGKEVLDFPTHFLPPAVPQFLHTRYGRIPPQLVPNFTQLYGRRRFCNRAGSRSLVVPACT